VPESWVSVWAQVLISHFSRKRHGAMGESGGGENFKIPICTPKHAAAVPQNPVVCFEIVRTRS